MTTAINYDTPRINGWNLVINALNEGKDISDFNKNADKIQKTYPSTDAIFRYVEGVKEAIIEYETTGEIPSLA